MRKVSKQMMRWTIRIWLLFSHCVSLPPHGLQHIRLPHPSPSPGACSNSCPLSRWCHPTISSSVIPFSSCLQSFPASRFFQWVNSLHQVVKVLEFQLQHQSFQWIFRVDFLWDWLVGSPCSPMDSQEFPPTLQFKSISSSALKIWEYCQRNTCDEAFLFLEILFL